MMEIRLPCPLEGTRYDCARCYALKESDPWPRDMGSTGPESAKGLG
jgi:hypothetical protein